MPGISVASLEALQQQGILKLTNKVIMVGDDDAPVVSAPFDSSGLLQALPAGYFSSGSCTTDGFTVSRSINVDTVMSDQSVQPDRSDVTADSLQVKVKFQETSNKAVLAIDNGVKIADLGSLTPFFSAVRKTDGSNPNRRFVMIGEDTLRNVIVVRHLPQVRLNAVGDQNWQRSSEVQFDYTFDAFPDPGLLDENGNPSDSQTWIGGPGWASLVSSGGAAAAAWQADTAYALNSLVSVSGDTLQATTAGTSGTSAPTPPASVGGTVDDGTVVWTRTA